MNEPIICPYCNIEQETIGGFIAHLKLLHPQESDMKELAEAIRQLCRMIREKF